MDADPTFWIQPDDLSSNQTRALLRFHLEQMKPMLITNIRAQLGDERIKSIKFTLG